jgi:hypothetical protein
MLLYLQRHADGIRSHTDIVELLEEMSFGLVQGGIPATLSPNRWSDWLLAVDEATAREE